MSSVASLQAVRESLPIFSFKNEIEAAVAQNSIVILVGETGSGKTTQLAQYLWEANKLKRICVTQPRRVAAVTVARRVAAEAGVTLGEEVGFAVRFSDKTSASTRIKFVTDGLLLREVTDDPLLAAYDVVILDEAHERSVSTDILFGLLKRTTQRRPEFRLIVTSATLDISKFSRYFDNCPVLTVPGRLYDVEVIYCPLTSTIRNDRQRGSLDSLAAEGQTSYVSAAVNTVLDIHFHEPQGDILVFLTGSTEIEQACKYLNKRVEEMFHKVVGEAEDEGIDPPENCYWALDIFPLYGSLPPEEQVRVFEPTPPNTRKVVIATNIAETSVTVDGVVYVVDPGYVKQTNFNGRSGIESLDVVRISKVAAEQRKGRAGRTRPGKCYRLYDELVYTDLDEDTVPELKRSNLGTVVLSLKAVGVTDVLGFDFIDPPDPEIMAQALKSLYYLEAITVDGAVTDTGKLMSKFPLFPTMARLLIEASSAGCSEAIATLVAMLSVPAIEYGSQERRLSDDVKEIRQEMYARAESRRGRGDLSLLLTIFEEWLKSGRSESWAKAHHYNVMGLREATSIRTQLFETLEKNGLQVSNSDESMTNIMRVFCVGYFMKTAKYSGRGGGFLVSNHRSYVVHIHPGSLLHDSIDSLDWVVFVDLLWTTKGYMRSVQPIKWEWIKDLYSKLVDVNIDRLSGRTTTTLKRKLEEGSGHSSGSAGGSGGGSADGDSGGDGSGSASTVEPPSKKSKIDVEAARARYLARKK